MATVDLPQLLPYQPARMSVQRYHELVRMGVFSEHDGIELLDGVVTEKMPKNPAHSLATRLCDLALSRVVSVGWHVVNQEPITLQRSEPEPDVAIVRGGLEEYVGRHPGIGDITLVVEVADTSLVTDRFKAQLYASAGITEYWIVNLADRVVEVHRLPSGQTESPHYESVTCYRADDHLPIVIDGVTVGQVCVREILGSH